MRAVKKSGIHFHDPVKVPISSLSPSAYNPRRISPQKFQSLKDNIRANGFLEPIVVQKKGLNIIGGHQRVRAVKEICVEDQKSLPEIPCVVIDVDDPTAKKLNISLNRIGGEFDNHLLGEVMTDLYRDRQLTIEEMRVIGFEAEEAAKYIAELAPPPPPPANDGVEGGKGMQLLTTCPQCGHEFKPAKNK